jgi:hypothetical protein
MDAEIHRLMVKAFPGFAGNEEPAALLAHKVGQGAVEPCGIYEMVGLHVTPEDKIDSFGAGIVIPGAEELPHKLWPPALHDPESGLTHEIEVKSQLTRHDD